MKTLRIALVLAAATIAVPSAAAQTIENTAWLHDLTENGAYTGCHVTSPSFTTYRLTMKEGNSVRLTVRAFENNTNVHAASIQGVDAGEVRVSAGESQVIEFTPPRPGTYRVLCDGQATSLSGTIIVQPSSDSGSAENATPGMSGTLAVLAVAVLALARRRV